MADLLSSPSLRLTDLNLKRLIVADVPAVADADHGGPGPAGADADHGAPGAAVAGADAGGR